MLVNDKHLTTIWYEKKTDKVNIIDQRLIPFELKIIESFSGFSPTPMTFEPQKYSQLQSHAPLKPVEPVTNTFKFL